MSYDHPIRFLPHYQTRVWGGRRLESVFHRELPTQEPFGESWEVSDRSEAMSTTPDGVSLNDLWQNHRQTVFGDVKSASGHFPLLMKILDACDDLSIQVHPPADVAPGLGGEPKTEMWFIAHADPGAKIYAGLRAGVTRAQFEEAIQNGTVADLVHVLQPRSGDCLFIPSGRIHAIGAGLLIFEIQQNSDTTYRVFDWNRVGLDGQPRTLHLQESLRSIDFTSSPPGFQQPDAEGRLITCEFFDVRQSRSHQPALGTAGEHLALAMVKGRLTAASSHLSTGDFAIVPACLSAAQRQLSDVSADAEWLEIRIPG